MKKGVLLLAIILLSSQALALCGDGACDSRSSWSNPDSGLGSENWDNCPADCSKVFNERPTWVTYHSNDELEAIMSDLVRDYSGIIRSETVGSSIEGRPIKIYVIGDGKGGFFFDGRLHGVEDCGTELGLQFVRWVLMSQDSKAKDLRDHGNLIFMPAVNPDSVGRQNNRRSYPDGTQVPYGVDLNRNFPAGWGSTGSSNSFDAYEYRGQSPASEPETQAMIKVFEDYDPRVYFNVHCGQAVASGGGDTTLSSRMVAIMRNESNRLGSDLFGLLSPHYSSSCGSGGYAKAQGCDGNTSSWLIEVAPWPQVPATLQTFIDRYWHNLWPLYLSGAQVARVSSLTSLPEQPDLVIPEVNDSKPVVIPSKLDNPADAGGQDLEPLAKSSLSASDLTRGSDLDVLIFNLVLPLKEVAPWAGLILFLAMIGGAFAMFANLGGSR